jgi:hypothetical protein
MTPPRATLALLLLVAAVLLAAGCAGKPAVDNHTDTSISGISPAVPQSKSLNNMTVVRQDNTHPEYIKMDADRYNVGEIVEFYLKNEGNETLSCMGDISSYRVYNESDESWLYPPVPVEPHPLITILPTLSEIVPGSSTSVFRINTAGWVPGTYRVQFGCLGISREYVIREVPAVTAP